MLITNVKKLADKTQHQLLFRYSVLVIGSTAASKRIFLWSFVPVFFYFATALGVNSLPQLQIFRYLHIWVNQQPVWFHGQGKAH